MLMLVVVPSSRLPYSVLLTPSLPYPFDCIRFSDLALRRRDTPPVPSGSSDGNLNGTGMSDLSTKKPRTRGGRNSKKRRMARAAPNHSNVAEASPFVGADARRADDSHKSEHLLAYDSCNANA